jgi:hypothetical protein
MANASDMAYNACARIRRENTTAEFPQALLRPSVFQTIDFRDGKVGGWLYMSSGDAFATWSCQTSQDRVEVVTTRRTGPASWARVWLSSGANLSVFVAAVSGLEIDEATGLTVTGGTPNPRLRCWFYPYSDDEAFETLPFSLSGNAWDSFPAIAAAGNQDVGYPPRLTRALYVSSNQNLTLNLGVNFVNYSRVAVVDQGGVWVDSWTSVNILNSGGANANILGSWANTPISILNP